VSGSSARQDAIESLPWMQALVLSLVVTRGLSYREVAARLGLSPKDTLGLVNDGLVRLRKSL
jgi:DNA-directed RNA polymerase specialized sigma24 family protein